MERENRLITYGAFIYNLDKYKYGIIFNYKNQPKYIFKRAGFGYYEIRDMSGWRAWYNMKETVNILMNRRFPHGKSIFLEEPRSKRCELT